MMSVDDQNHAIRQAWHIRPATMSVKRFDRGLGQQLGLGAKTVQNRRLSMSLTREARVTPAHVQHDAATQRAIEAWGRSG